MPRNGLCAVPPGLLNFKLCLLAKHLAPDHTCTVCVQGLSMSPATRNPVDLTHGRSIRSRKRQPFESGVFRQLTAAAAGTNLREIHLRP